MKQEILISGFGGQGLMRLGKIIAEAALLENKYVTCFPSYGAEMRGGTAHCYVKISHTPIASPLVDSPDIAIILNQPSLDKFKKKLKKGVLLILNANLIKKPILDKSIQCINTPLNTIALECGNLKVVNSVVLGILISLKNKLFKKQTIITVIKKTFTEPGVRAANLKGFKRGQNLPKNQIGCRS